MDRDQSIVGVIAIFLILLLLFFAGGMLGGGEPSGGAGGGGGGAGAGTPCTGDSECPSDEICVSGFCAPAGSCGTDSDCPSGTLCSGGKCKSPCTDNTDCEEGEICVSGVCFSSETGCESDADCEEGFSCVDNICQQSECSPENPCPDGFDCIGGICQPSSCTTSAECPEGEICLDDTCQPPECSMPDDPCPPGQACEDGECVPAPCTTDLDCPSDAHCIDGTCQFVECVTDEDCVGDQECIDYECVSPCDTCVNEMDCLEEETCLVGCCITPSELGGSLPFGDHSLSLYTVPFCDGCPAEDSLTTMMFLDPRIEEKYIGTTLVAEKDGGVRAVVAEGTIFVKVLSLDMENAALCKIVTNDDGNAKFNYSSYPFCDDAGCKITFIFCCANIEEGCLIPVCLNDGTIVDHDLVSPCPGVSTAASWPEEASVEDAFSNLYPAVDSVSIPPKPKMMGMEFAFQLCFPILVIFGLLSAAMFASGRNPFEMFSLYTPRFKRAPERAIRPRGMNWNINSIIGSIASAAQTGSGMKKGTVSVKTGASAGQKLPGFGGIKGAMGGLKGSTRALAHMRKSGVTGVVKGGDLASKPKQTQASTRGGGGPGGATVIAGGGPEGGGAALSQAGKGFLSQLGSVFATVGSAFMLKLLTGSPLFSWLVYGVEGTSFKGGLKELLDKKISNISEAAKAINAEIAATKATFQVNEVKDESGKVIGYTLTYVDPSTGKLVTTDTMKDDANTTALQKIAAAKSMVMAPLLAAQVYVCGSVQQETEKERDKAMKELAGAYAPDEEAKKKVDKLGEVVGYVEVDGKKTPVTGYDQLAERIENGTATRDEIVAAAIVVKDKGDTAGGKKVAEALEKFVLIPDGTTKTPFSQQLDQARELAAEGKVDAADVEAKALFVLGVVGAHAKEEAQADSERAGRILQNSTIELDPNTGQPILEAKGRTEGHIEREKAAIEGYKAATEEAGQHAGVAAQCAREVGGIVGSPDKPGQAAEVLASPVGEAGTPSQETKAQLAKMVDMAAGAVTYSAAANASDAARADFARAENEVYHSTYQDRAVAASENRELSPSENGNIKLSAVLTDTADGLGTISKSELQKRAAMEFSIDPTGVPQSNAIKAAAAEAGIDGTEKGLENAGKVLATSYSDAYIAQRYNLETEQVAQMREDIAKEQERDQKKFGVTLEEGRKDLLVEQEMEKRFEERNNQIKEMAEVYKSAGIPAPEIPPPAQDVMREARDNSAELRTNLAAGGDSRDEALSNISNRIRDNVTPAPGVMPPTDEEWKAMSPPERRAEQYRDLDQVVTAELERVYPSGKPSEESRTEAKAEEASASYEAADKRYQEAQERSRQFWDKATGMDSSVPPEDRRKAEDAKFDELARRDGAEAKRWEEERARQAKEQEEARKRVEKKRKGSGNDVEM